MLINKEVLIQKLTIRLEDLKRHSSGFSSDFEVGTYEGQETALDTLIDELKEGVYDA